MNFLKKDKISNIDISTLKDMGIKYLLIDLDNTLMDLGYNITNDTITWINNVKNSGINICMLTNNTHIKRIKHASKTLDIPYVLFALKPTLIGYNKAIKKMGKIYNISNMEKSEICIIGDQVFTDYYMAKRAKISCILVSPITLKEDIIMKYIKRPLEKKIIQKITSKNK